MLRAGRLAAWAMTIAIPGSAPGHPMAFSAVSCRAASDPFDAIMLDPAGRDLFLRPPSFGIRAGLRVRFSPSQLIGVAGVPWRPLVRRYLGNEVRFPAAMRFRGIGCLDRVRREFVPLSISVVTVEPLAI